MASAASPSPRELAAGIARGFAGATLLSLPMALTAEMWWAGTQLDPLQLATLVAIDLPLLFLVVRHLGFRDGQDLDTFDYVADALVAFGIGVVAATIFLTVFGITVDRTSSELLQLVAMQTLPCSVGAAIARSKFVGEQGELREEESTYPYEILLMVAGAGLFVFAIAPTDEVMMIGGALGPWETLGLVGLSMLGLHALVYMLGFQGQHRSEAPTWSVFLGYTVTGYVAALLTCLALLVAFGRTAGLPLVDVLTLAVVLGVPASVGAGAARLIL